MIDFHSHHDYADRGHLESLIAGLREDQSLIAGLREDQSLIAGLREDQSLIAGLREDLGRAEARIYELEQTVEAHRENESHLHADGSSA